MMAAEGHSDQLPSDTEVRMKQRSGTELLCAEKMAPTDIQGSRPRGRCRPHWMWLWLYVLGLVPVFLAVDVALGAGRLLAFLAVAGALGPGDTAGLLGWGCGFRPRGQCWPLEFWLCLEAPGLVPAFQAVALVPTAGASLSSCGCGFRPLGCCWPLGLRLRL